ncbi:MAG: hypothetical protein ACQEVA_00795 [Myxococcota bacterium]
MTPLAPNSTAPAKSRSRTHLSNTMLPILLLLCVTCAALMPGCSHDRKVGGACSADADCKDRCLESFPGGMCTLSCESDDECTNQTVCADTEGGVCLFPCDSTQECLDELGDGYACDDETSFDDREIRVCVDSG